MQPVCVGATKQSLKTVHKISSFAHSLGDKVVVLINFFHCPQELSLCREFRGFRTWLSKNGSCVGGESLPAPHIGFWSQPQTLFSGTPLSTPYLRLGVSLKEILPYSLSRSSLLSGRCSRAILSIPGLHVVGTSWAVRHPSPWAKQTTRPHLCPAYFGVSLLQEDWP